MIKNFIDYDIGRSPTRGNRRAQSQKEDQYQPAPGRPSGTPRNHPAIL
jgi:hypothetical protein